LVRNWVSEIFFVFFSMWISLSHTLDCESCMFTWVDLSHFFCHLNKIVFFFIFIIQHFDNWELNFIIWFNLFFMRLSWSHDLSYKFCRLAEVDFIRLNMSSSRYLKKEYDLIFHQLNSLKNVFNIQVLCSWFLFF
jgi:hypothetical protein